MIISGRGKVVHHFWSRMGIERNEIGEIVIHQGINSISELAFSHFKNLKNVVIPKSITKIGHSVFWFCSNLEEIEIPEGVTEIGFHAFNHCEQLESVIIPFSVTNIDIGAFGDCFNLFKVEFLPFHLNDADLAVLQVLKSHGSFESKLWCQIMLKLITMRSLVG